MKPNYLPILILLAGFMVACGEKKTSRAPGFNDVLTDSGIAFVHTDGSSGRYYLLETVTAGLGLFDYDNDGKLDIYFANGSELPGKKLNPLPTNVLYRNLGNHRFEDVTLKSGTGDTGYGMGCVMGDYDNDGNLDIYISNAAEDVLYHNNGDGTFTNVSKKAGLGDPRLGAGACFADFNRDGWLDLFVANYVMCSLEKPLSCTRMGVPLYCDPSTFDNMYEPLPASIYFNNGNGTFRDASKESGIAAYKGRGMGVACTDYNNDGNMDIYIANDVSENFLYQNQGDGTFKEDALFAGVAYDLHGHEQGSMGCDFGDYDNDGWLDIMVTSYQRQLNTLYRNRGDGAFEDVTQKAGLTIKRMEYVSWATFFFDYDNDGDQDIFVANGHLQDRIEEIEPTTKYYEPNQLFRNNNDGTFTEVSAESGPGFQIRLSTRGGAYGDLDNDGDLDIVLSNSRQVPTILINELQNGNHWINLRLVGVKSNRDGIGSRIQLQAGGKTQIREIRAGGSYQSHYDLRVHFGLGRVDKIDEIKITWPSGQVDTHKHIHPDRFLELREGSTEIKIR